MSIYKKSTTKLFGEIGGRIMLKVLLGRLLSFFHTDSHKYFCISMVGNSYGCNVKALANYIQEVDPDAIVIWAFSPIMHNQLQLSNSVIIYSWSYYYHLVSSRFILSNSRIPLSLFPYKSSKQRYLQMWHGTALKRIEKDASSSLSGAYKELAIADSKKIDFFISGSQFMTKIYREAFWYEGSIYEVGTPRNDLFFHDNPDIICKVRRVFKLAPHEKTVLYAPTFRSDYSIESYNIDVERIVAALQKKWGGTWRFLIRLHPNLLSCNYYDIIHGRFPDATDASSYPDMQELLYSCDILLTDYSASMFDFMYSRKPCFLYVNDKNSYDRGFYWNINELPFPSFHSNEEIESTIEQFDNEAYQCCLTKFLLTIGDKETGHASKSVYELICS